MKRAGHNAPKRRSHATQPINYGHLICGRGTLIILFMTLFSLVTVINRNNTSTMSCGENFFSLHTGNNYMFL